MQDGESVGALLKRTREEKNMAVAQVAEELNTKQEHIEAMESDTILNFLPSSYARGFLRNYAQFLGLDHHEIMEHFDMLHKSEPPRIYLKDIGPLILVERRPRGTRKVTTLLLFVLIAVVIFAAVYSYQKWFSDWRTATPEDEGKTETGDVTPEESPKAGGTETSVQVEPLLTLEVRFVKNTRVAETIDGTVIPGKFYSANLVEKFEAHRDLVLDIDEGANVEVYHEGRIQSTGTGKVRVTLNENGFKAEKLDE